MRIENGLRAPWSLVRLASMAVAFGCVFVLVYLVTVRTVEGRSLGDASLRGALLTNSRLVGPVDQILNAISIASLLGAIAVVTVVALVRLARLQGLAAIGIVVGSNLSTLLLKNVVLSRPDLGLDEATPATLNSLPGGHATAAFSAVAALLFVVSPKWRLTVVTGGAAYATLAALATMSAGWHRAGDAIAAFLLVGVWSLAAAMFLMIFGTRVTIAGPSLAGSSLRRKVEATAVICLALGAAVGMILTVVPPVRESTVGSAAAFLAGGLLIAGTSMAVLIAVLAALEIIDAEQRGRSDHDPARPRFMDEA